MINFFRKKRKKFADDNKTLKYTRYAIGEIVLVVVGILIALQINNWNQAKKERVREISLLKELKINLQTNIHNLEMDITTQIESEHHIKRLIYYIDNKLPYNDSIPFFLTRGGYAPDVILTSSAFETLKTSGIGLIKSDSLRQNIIGLFEVSYPYLMQNTRRLEDQLWPAVVIPLTQKHCRVVNGLWVPVDYELMINDQEFLNMWTLRETLRRVSTTIKKKTVKETMLTIELIDKTLKR